MAVTLSDEDYLRLLEAAECDDMIGWCEECGAWFDMNDPRRATVADFEGCWFAATKDSKYTDTCLKGLRPGRKQIE